MAVGSDSEKTDLHGVLEGLSFPCLEIVSGPKAGSRLPLKRGKNQIGRSGENEVVLDDSSVSRRHSVIEVGENGSFLSDLGSRNGTKVEGEKIGQSTPLHHNIKIKIGIYQLRFLTEEAGPVLADEPPPVGEEPEEGVPPESVEPLEPLESGVSKESARPQPAKLRRRLPLPILIIGLVAAVALLSFVLARPSFFRFRSSKTQGVKAREATTLGKAEGEVGQVLPAEPLTVVEQPQGLQPFFIDFSSTPIAAQIFFGDQPIGVTPFRTSTKLAIGKWYEARALFQLSEIGDVIEERASFSPEAGASVVPVSFSAKIGIFKIGSLPRDVQLYLEGYFEKDPYRAKPIKFAEIIFGKPVYVPFGRYVIELRKSKQLGISQTYLDEVVYRREFHIHPEQTTYTLDLSDEALQTFPVQIRSIPPGAKVFIDEKESGTTPFTGTFPIGEHLMTLKREGYFDFVQVIKMSLNMPYVAEIPLKTSEAGELINKAETLIREDRPVEALPILVEAFSKKPSPREVALISHRIGLCYLKQKNYASAEDYFLKAMQHDEYKYAGRLGLATVTLGQGDAIKALKILIEVLVSSEDPKVRADAGILFQRISPLKSVMYVTSEPAEARVFVNGNEVNQKTPLILHELGVGSYRIQMRKEGYEDAEVKLNLGVSEFRPVVARLKKAGG